MMLKNFHPDHPLKSPSISERIMNTKKETVKMNDHNVGHSNACCLQQGGAVATIMIFHA